MIDVEFAAIVLGSGQDGGVPQFGAPDVAGPERMASSVAVVDSGGTAVLLDASPDLRHQHRDLMSTGEYGMRTSPSPFDAVLLTHAHMGHYAGLLQFGKEAHNANGVRCFASHAMLRFLQSNEPWAALFRDGNLLAYPVEPGEPFDIAPDLHAIGHAVPHRPDCSDNLGFEVVTASGRSMLYLPDLDRWSDWPEAWTVLSRVDLAFLDGTFYEPAEHPERAMSQIPHPLVTDTVERFASLTASTRLVLTHLNWTNRLCDPAGDAQTDVLRAGFLVAEDGMRLPL